MRTLFLIVFLSTAISCDKGGNDSSPRVVTKSYMDEALTGSWFRETPESTPERPLYETLVIDSAGSFELQYAFLDTVNQFPVIKVLISRGNFVKMNDFYRLEFTYGNCNNMVPEYLHLFEHSGSLYTHQGDKTKMVAYSKNSTSEYKNGQNVIESPSLCREMAGFKVTHGRKPASTKAKK